MSSHTEGPWEVIERLSDTQSGTDLYVGLPDRRDEMKDYSLRYAEEHVAHIYGNNREPNARLIAAAPELLAALEACAALTYIDSDVKDAARAAIAKAKGKE